MTGEEAIKIIKNYDVNGCGYCHQGGDEVEVAFKMAIKALEQEPVLDKIRAEIIELRSRQNVGVLECLDIIDKYKAELKGENNE